MPRLDYAQVGLPLKDWAPPEAPRQQRLPALNGKEQEFVQAMVEVQFSSAAEAVRTAWPWTIEDPLQMGKYYMRKPHVRYAVEVLRNRSWDKLVLGRLGSLKETYGVLRDIATERRTAPYLRLAAASKMARLLGVVRQQERKS